MRAPKNQILDNKKEGKNRHWEATSCPYSIGTQYYSVIIVPLFLESKLTQLGFVTHVST